MLPAMRLNDIVDTQATSRVSLLAAIAVLASTYAAALPAQTLRTGSFDVVAGAGQIMDFREDAGDNDTLFDSGIICVYPISGQYALLNRLLYYVLIVFVVVGQGHLWLIGGAFAYILTNSGTAAIDALVLLASSSLGSAIDLDIFGATAIMAAAYPVTWIMISTTKVHNRDLYGIITLWLVIVGLGLVFGAWARGLVGNSLDTAVNLPCFSNATGELLTNPGQLNVPNAGYNCSYDCFDSHHVLRDPSQISAIRFQFAPPDYFFWLNASLIFTVAGCYVGWMLYRCFVLWSKQGISVRTSEPERPYSRDDGNRTGHNSRPNDVSHRSHSLSMLFRELSKDLGDPTALRREPRLFAGSILLTIIVGLVHDRHAGSLAAGIWRGIACQRTAT
jgi:hypothetical protein